MMYSILNIWPVGAAMAAAAIATRLAFITPVAIAHENWISRSQYVDPISGAWCCDEHDCSALEEMDVREIPAGFMVHETYFVARTRVLPSGDENYWACFNSEGTGAHDRAKGVRCFFAPMNV